MCGMTCPCRKLRVGIRNLADPFGRDVGEAGASAAGEGLIHVRIQQRNGRKTLTTVQGLSDDYDKRKIIKVCKKVLVVASLLCGS